MADIRMIRRLTGVAVLALAAVAPGSAQAPSEASNPALFVKKAALTNMAEIELGAVAERKATNGDVKAFARLMVADHTAAQTALIAAAKKATAVPMPTELDAKHKTMKQDLEAKSGAAFDRFYMDHMAMGHEEALTFLKDASEHQADPAFKEWATKTVPTVQTHLAEVQRIKRVLGPTTSR